MLPAAEAHVSGDLRTRQKSTATAAPSSGTRMQMGVVAAAVAFGGLQQAAAKMNATAPMRGWTTWDLSAITNHPVYGREWMNASRVLEQSDALKSSGLMSSGFEYINVDSFWASDPTQITDSYGRWTFNTTRFPNGIRPVADYVHANGQKVRVCDRLTRCSGGCGVE